MTNDDAPSWLMIQVRTEMPLDSPRCEYLQASVAYARVCWCMLAKTVPPCHLISVFWDFAFDLRAGCLSFDLGWSRAFPKLSCHRETTCCIPRPKTGNMLLLDERNEPLCECSVDKRADREMCWPEWEGNNTAYHWPCLVIRQLRDPFVWAVSETYSYKRNRQKQVKNNEKLFWPRLSLFIFGCVALEFIAKAVLWVCSWAH